MWAAQYYKYKEPRTLLSSGGLGTMGYGLGASIGAKMGCPETVSYTHLDVYKRQLHNLYFYNTMMEEIRAAIEAGEYQAYKKKKIEGMTSGK